MWIADKMETLPEEVIGHILTDSSLSISDILNFSSASSSLREMINSNRNLWRSKYFQRWPKSDYEVSYVHWRNEYLARSYFEKQILALLSQMSDELCHLNRKSIGDIHLSFTLSIIESQKYGYYYLRDFLRKVNSLPVSESLTDKYYGKILMEYIHKKHCTPIWKNLLSSSEREQTLEKGAIFVTIWQQKFKAGLWDYVRTELNSTADLVRQHLLEQYKDHPLKDVPEETQLLWRNENLTDNMFEAKHCQLIIWAMNYIFFEVLTFQVVKRMPDLYRTRVGIDHALKDKKTHPTVFAVIYESVARRLGVKIEVLEFLQNYFLRWKENYRDEDSLTHYINYSAKEIFLNGEGLSSVNINVRTPCNMQQVAYKVAVDLYPKQLGDVEVLEKNRIDLLLTIKPFNLKCHRKLCQTYMEGDLEAEELLQKLEGLRANISNEDWLWFQPIFHLVQIHQNNRGHIVTLRTPTVWKRVEGMKLAVGMIVREGRFRRMGVIYGWTVSPGSNSEIPRQASQVSYNVMLDGGSYDCMLEHELKILHTPPFIYHECIGRFFDEYCTTYYRPNKFLQAQYPEDMKALQEILRKDRRI